MFGNHGGLWKSLGGFEKVWKPLQAFGRFREAKCVKEGIDFSFNMQPGCGDVSLVWEPGRVLEGSGRSWKVLGGFECMEGSRRLWEGAFLMKTVGFTMKNDDSGAQGWEAGEESGGGFLGVKER